MKVIIWLFLCIFFTLLLIARMCFGVVPNFMDITLRCDPSSTNQQVVCYRFWENGIGTNWLLVGSTPTNTFTITNVLITVPHIYGVTASNIFGESDMSVTVLAPSDPRPPINLRVINTSLIVPVPSTIAGGTDLVNWQEKQKFRMETNGNLRVTFQFQPRDPVFFWHLWEPPQPPIP